MGDGIALAGCAMVSRELQQEALVHNLANASTPGFKAARVFAKVLEEVGGGSDAVREIARNQDIYIDFSQGPLQWTDRALDLALEGQGFFVVQTPDGERYTRNGNLTSDATGQLVNGSGFPIMTEGGPLVLEGSEIVVNKTGELLVDGEVFGKLQIKNFLSLHDLVQEGMGLFGPRPGAELKETESAAVVFQGCLEGSNVTPMDEMARMTSLLKYYEASHRMLQMQNTTLSRTVNDLVLR